MNYKPGTIIRIIDTGEVKLLDAASEKIRVAVAASELAASQYYNAQENLWKVVHELYPALKDFQAFYDHVKHEICVKYKEEKSDES